MPRLSEVLALLVFTPGSLGCALLNRRHSEKSRTRTAMRHCTLMGRLALVGTSVTTCATIEAPLRGRKSHVYWCFYILENWNVVFVCEQSYCCIFFAICLWIWRGVVAAKWREREGCLWNLWICVHCVFDLVKNLSFVNVGWVCGCVWNCVLCFAIFECQNWMILVLLC